jgi:hypothetical protein
MNVCDMGKEMKGKKTSLIFGIAVLLLTTSIIPSILGQSSSSVSQHNRSPITLLLAEKTPTITVYVIGKTGLEKQETMLTTSDALRIYEKYQELKKEATINPYSHTTQRKQQEFIDLLKKSDALPTGISNNQLLTLTQPAIPPWKYLRKGILPFQNKASEWFCNFATYGEGSAFPIIILPRFIPFILTPIPRAFVYWSTDEGLTSVGGLISKTGFLAGGQQQGIALGFWGIGFSIFLPPIMSYGIFGYALFTRVTAQEIEFWPPNTPPEITQTDPADGQQMVSISTKELRFEINDEDKDMMSYNVTTNPYIGSGSGGLKPSGTYSIPISGLQDLTTYTWHIEVTDGKDTEEKTMTFSTEAVAPIISNPQPADGERDIPMNLPSLQFSLKDYQGDAMEYTVETSPNIGSKHETGVHDGTYMVPISGMTYGAQYRWYLNVSDGTHWTRKTYSYQTGYPSPFDPFTYGWHYRKQITIDHTKITGDLTNFPILLSATDIDLTKAQQDGGDILFMNGPGAATKWHHEIESFKVSSGEIIAWVNIPNLSTSEDATFYMYYGNPDCIDQEYPEKTWDTNYKGVWHMNDGSGNIFDSTAHSECIKNGNPTYQQIGKVGTAINFDGVGDFFDGGDDSDYDFGTGDMTVECWLWSNSATNRIPVVKKDWSTHGNGWMLWSSSSKTYFHISNGHGSIANCYIEDSISDGQWRHVVGRRNGDTIYLNLNCINSNSKTGASNYDLSSSWKFKIGDDDGISEGYEWIGLIDEVRISNVYRTDAWISTEYTNQNNPSGFVSLGLEEPGP